MSYHSWPTIRACSQPATMPSFVPPQRCSVGYCVSSRLLVEIMTGPPQEAFKWRGWGSEGVREWGREGVREWGSEGVSCLPVAETNKVKNSCHVQKCFSWITEHKHTRFVCKLYWIVFKLKATLTLLLLLFLFFICFTATPQPYNIWWNRSKHKFCKT